MKGSHDTRARQKASYAPVVTVKSRILLPSNIGSSWLCTKITPHMNAVNQMAVCWLGWYFRMTIGCGTGRSLEVTKTQTPTRMDGRWVD